MKTLHKGIVAAFLLAIIGSVQAQSAIVRGQISAGVYENIITDGAGSLKVSVSGQPTTDPCIASAVAKSSAIINITSATTTQLVALSGTTVIYICNVAMTVSQVVTTANIIKFVQGTGSSCGTGTADITGGFGTGGITAAPPLVVNIGNGGTLFKTAAGSALCATTTIGGSAAFSGVITYVQQ